MTEASKEKDIDAFFDRAEKFLEVFTALNDIRENLQKFDRKCNKICFDNYETVDNGDNRPPNGEKSSKEPSDRNDRTHTNRDNHIRRNQASNNPNDSNHNETNEDNDPDDDDDDDDDDNEDDLNEDSEEIDEDQDDEDEDDNTNTETESDNDNDQATSNITRQFARRNKNATSSVKISEIKSMDTSTLPLDSKLDFKKSLNSADNKNDSLVLASSTTLDTQNESRFQFKENPCQILEGLNKMRIAGALCDITLKVNTDEFKCHKCVLASLSQYFEAMFSNQLAESKQDTIMINELESTTMQSIIEYAYTSSLVINNNNVQSLLSASNLFDIKPIKQACCRYMEWQMEASNSIGIHLFAESHDCSELKKISFKFILNNFLKIIEHEEFLTLSPSKLIEVIGDDNLSVPNEDLVYNAVIKWLNHSFEERKSNFFQVLENVRLPLIKAYFLYDKVQTDLKKIDCGKCQTLLQEALMYNLLKDRRNQLQNKRTRSRCSFNHLEALIVIAGEDENVVLKSVDCYIPSIQHWSPLRSSPLALSKHGIVAHDETLIYMTGGEAPDTMPNDTLWQYNSILNEWKQLSSLQTARSELGVAIVDGCIYAVGGIDDEKHLATVERYDPCLNTWKYCAPMKLPLTNPTVTSLNGLLYVIGGTFIDDEDVVDTVQVYNPSTNQWKELSPLIMPRSGCGSCAFNDQIYVLGGFCGTELSYFECYDVNLDRWKTMPSMLEARFKPGVAVLNNLIYVCGGRKSENSYCDSIEAFNFDNQQWSIVTFMSKARGCLSCAALRVQNPAIELDYLMKKSVKT